MSEKLGTGPYSVEITVRESRTKTFIVRYEKDIAEAYAYVEDLISNDDLDMSDEFFDIEIVN